jgi:hypothetical protein
MLGRTSVRAALVAVVCSVLVAVTAPSASARTTTASAAASHAAASHAAPITADFVPFDGPPCPPNPYGYGDGSSDGTYQRIVGIARTRLGPARFQADVCFVFVGALGGEELSGTFALKTIAGTLSGTAHGIVGFADPDHYALTLDVARGSLLLHRVRGSLTFDTYDAGRDGKDLTGTLTSDLHVSWFGHSFPVPLT